MITILIPTPIITILKNISVEIKDGTVTGMRIRYSFKEGKNFHRN
jgi:hypothetical protein